VAAKTLEEFYAWYRSSGENLFRNISDQMIWDAATKAAEERFTSTNSARDEISALIIEIYKNRPVDRVYSREELISYLQRAETSPVA
jgi:hypothetical protein